MLEHKWSPTLRDWEQRYIRLHEDAILFVAAMEWPEVEHLREEIERVGNDNCSWQLYHAAKDVLRHALPGDEEGLVTTRRLADEIRAERERGEQS